MSTRTNVKNVRPSNATTKPRIKDQTPAEQKKKSVLSHSKSKITTSSTSSVNKSLKQKEEDKLKLEKTKIKSTPISNVNKASKTSSSSTTSVRKVPSSRAPPPATPPSTRVTRTQFFPSKKMYSNALAREQSKIVAEPAKERKNKAKSSTEEGAASSDTSSISERPRTATLRKPSIVNGNVVGPEAPKLASPPPSKDEELYEDDFDSYESDFEAVTSSETSSTSNLDNLSDISSSSTSSSHHLAANSKRVNSASTDEERKMDSGNFEMPEGRHKQILDNIKESIEKENANLPERGGSGNMGSLSDEGFEEAKSLQFINFLAAQRKYQRRKSEAKKRQRGEEILSMIRLDYFSFTLFDRPAVPYDEFIRNFGKSNSVQVTVQTGDDNLDEQVQTDDISVQSKWTQCPPRMPKGENDDWALYKCNYLGVGSDNIDKNISNKIEFNSQRLGIFLDNVENFVLNYLSERMSQQVEAENSKTNLPLSKATILLDIKKFDFLKSKQIKYLSFSHVNKHKFLTVHNERAENQSTICQWNIYQLNQPEIILKSYGKLTCATFGFEANLIFGGFNDGTVALWDTKETQQVHNLVTISDCKFMRGPTYITEINKGHCTLVVQIKMLTQNVNSDQNNLFDNHKATEICSLDQEGELIVWGVVYKEFHSNITVAKQGLAHWGNVMLTINVRIFLKNLFGNISDFSCTDLAVNQLDAEHLYISTSCGVVLHCLSNGGRTSVQEFRTENNQCEATCLETCPFSPEFLLAGFNNGEICFYSRLVKKPLKVISNKNVEDEVSKNKIEIIQWSSNRPQMFYTKDNSNRISLWNLNVNDLCPVHTIPFKENIVALKLSPPLLDNDNKETTHMIIATDEGNVYIHVLDEEHGKQDLGKFRTEERVFLNYINRFV